MVEGRGRVDRLPVRVEALLDLGRLAPEASILLGCLAAMAGDTKRLEIGEVIVEWVTIDVIDVIAIVKTFSTRVLITIQRSLPNHQPRLRACVKSFLPHKQSPPSILLLLTPPRAILRPQ